MGIMKPCGVCGDENPYNYNFCLRCGQPIILFATGTGENADVPTLERDRATSKSAVEDCTMIENLIDARNSRRKIIELLTKQQLDDSCCAERLKHVALHGKRKLLGLLAAWLVSFEPGKEFSDPDERIFAAIGTAVSLGDWLSLQRCETALNQRKLNARQVEDERYTVYKRVAPHGTISVWFSNGAEKAKAERLQEEYRTALASRESIERELSVAREDIRKMIARFLRDAVDPKSIEHLLKESGVKAELASLIQELEENGISIWGGHAQKQRASLCELEKESASLSHLYSTPSAETGPQIILSANAGGK
jgi:hypothetical protein